MKTRFTFLAVILLLTTTTYCQVSLYDDYQKVKTVETNEANTLYIPMGFADSEEFNANLDVLDGKQIHHVDLIYTSYKESDDFDQLALNADRRKRIEELVPKLKFDAPSFSYLEQIGAESREEAKSYFHGFAIHYGESIGYGELKEYFHKFQTAPSKRTLDNSEGADLKFKSGTILHVPADAVTYKDGSAVTGEYDILYKEYRNHAEIILSGIPMTYNEEDTAKLFNSVGMFEIRGVKDGEELVLQKDIEVDFVCNNRMDDVSFYQMDDQGDWTESEPLDFDGPRAEVLSTKSTKTTFSYEEERKMAMEASINFEDYTAVASVDRGRFDISSEGTITGSSAALKSGFVNNELYKIDLDELGFNKYLERIVNYEAAAYVDGLIVKSFPETRTFMIQKSNVMSFIEFVAGYSAERMGVTPLPESLDFSFVAIPREVLENPKWKPIRYKSLVAPKFAVYNCDSKSSIKKPMAMRPKYFDRSTGEQVENIRVTYVVDMSLLSARSWNQKRIVVSKKGQNKILAFTERDQIFILSEEDFAKVSDKKKPKFKMLDITGYVSNPLDLQKLLDV